MSTATMSPYELTQAFGFEMAIWFSMMHEHGYAVVERERGFDIDVAEWGGPLWDEFVLACDRIYTRPVRGWL